MRGVTAETVAQYLLDVAELQQAFPEFIAGFDLVGQEDLGEPLISFLDQILAGQEANPELKMFFHAGETDWLGTETDINIIDALLLNTTRIGHGYAIAKHPEAAKMARDRGVPIEVCLVGCVYLLFHQSKEEPSDTHSTQLFELSDIRPEPSFTVPRL